MSVGLIFALLCVAGGSWALWNGMQAVRSRVVHSQRGRIAEPEEPITFRVMVAANLCAGVFLMSCFLFLAIAGLT